jgi:hypothetical protein
LGYFAPFDLIRGRIVFFWGPFQVILRQFWANVGLFQAVFWDHFGCFKAILGLLGSLSGAVFGPFLAVSGHF